jgi:hypothetical protein
LEFQQTGKPAQGANEIDGQQRSSTGSEAARPGSRLPNASFAATSGFAGVAASMDRRSEKM